MGEIKYTFTRSPDGQTTATVVVESVADLAEVHRMFGAAQAETPDAKVGEPAPRSARRPSSKNTKAPPNKPTAATIAKGAKSPSGAVLDLYAGEQRQLLVLVRDHAPVSPADIATALKIPPRQIGRVVGSIALRARHAGYQPEDLVVRVGDKRKGVAYWPGPLLKAGAKARSAAASPSGGS